MSRWHLDVGEDHVGQNLIGHPNQLARIGDRRHHVHLGDLEHPHDALSREGIVLADHDADMSIHQGRV